MTRLKVVHFQFKPKKGEFENCSQILLLSYEKSNNSKMTHLHNLTRGI